MTFFHDRQQQSSTRSASILRNHTRRECPDCKFETWTVCVSETKLKTFIERQDYWDMNFNKALIPFQLKNDSDSPLPSSSSDRRNSKRRDVQNKDQKWFDKDLKHSQSQSSTEVHNPAFHRGYRLQRYAYATNRKEVTFQKEPDNVKVRNSYFRAGTSISQKSRLNSRPLASRSMEDLSETKQREIFQKSLLRLPNIVIDTATEKPEVFRIPTASFYSSLSSTYTHSLLPPTVPPERRVRTKSLTHFPSSETSVTSSTTSRQSPTDLSSSSKSTPKSPSRTRVKRTRAEVADEKKEVKGEDHNKLAMKMSLPCKWGCCYCVYTTLLGPVKVYFTRGEPAKKGPFLGGIKDGHGRLAIPSTRKEDVMGLVYDSRNHSLHPPAKGQRPLYRDLGVRGAKKKSVQGKGQR